MFKIISRAINACNENANQHLRLADSKINEQAWAQIQSRDREALELSEQARKHLRMAWNATEIPAILKQIWIELKRK